LHEAEPLAARYAGPIGTVPKISRGEKYAHMPWVMLDYPRWFEPATGHFAVRSFFWWGHFFSLRLQLSGQYALLADDLRKQLPSDAGWYTGFTTDPWNQQLPNEDWVDEPGSEEQEPKTNYFIAAAKLPLDQWKVAEIFLEEKFAELMKALVSSSP
jgi:hypothetical protein